MRTTRSIFATATVAAVSTIAVLPAAGDDTGDAFGLSVRHDAQLLPTLYAREFVGYPEDGRTYAYTTRPSIRVGDRTVARLREIRGDAGPRVEVVRIPLSRSVRRAVRAEARRRGTRYARLHFVHDVERTSRTEGDLTPLRQTLRDTVRLRIPRR